MLRAYCEFSLQNNQLDKLLNVSACTLLSEGRHHTVNAYRKLNVIEAKPYSAFTARVSRAVKVTEVDSPRAEIGDKKRYSHVTICKSASRKLVCITARSGLHSARHGQHSHKSACKAQDEAIVPVHGAFAQRQAQRDG